MRTRIRPRSLRITWPDGSDVTVAIGPRGAGKCAVEVMHNGLRGAAGVRGAKAFWGARLDAMRESLER